jgi:hypothetical protein
MKLKFSRQLFVKISQISSFIKILPVGAKLFHDDRRTDMKLTIAFRSFEKAPKNARYLRRVCLSVCLNNYYTHFNKIYVRELEYNLWFTIGFWLKSDKRITDTWRLVTGSPPPPFSLLTKCTCSVYDVIFTFYCNMFRHNSPFVREHRPNLNSVRLSRINNITDYNLEAPTRVKFCSCYQLINRWHGRTFSFFAVIY